MGLLFYYVGSEFFSSNSPSTVFTKALKRVKADERVTYTHTHTCARTRTHTHAHTHTHTHTHAHTLQQHSNKFGNDEVL